MVDACKKNNKYGTGTGERGQEPGECSLKQESRMSKIFPEPVVDLERINSKSKMSIDFRNIQIGFVVVW